MPKREMSKEEYYEQQIHYRFNFMDPTELQKQIDKILFQDSFEDEEKHWKIKDLKDKLIVLLKKKIEICLTKRQKDVIKLYLMSKKQDDMGKILGVTQEAAWSRLTLSIKRLQKSCKKDKEIQSIIEEIKNL